MKKLLSKLQTEIDVLLWRIKNSIQVWNWKRKYPDYEDNNYNCGDMKHIWGYNCGSDNYDGENIDLYTCNDLEIIYHRDLKEYSLSIECIYMFTSKRQECEYLEKLLNSFTQYMNTQGLNTNLSRRLFTHGLSASLSEPSIEELYSSFKTLISGHIHRLKNE